MFRRLFGGRVREPLSGRQRDDIFAYLVEELKVAAFKDNAATAFYSLNDMSSGTQRLRNAAQEVLRRHAEIEPPELAAANYHAWQGTYRAWSDWVERISSALDRGIEPQTSWGQEMYDKALRAADQTQRLHHLIGLTQEEALAMGIAAHAAVQEEA